MVIRKDYGAVKEWFVEKELIVPQYKVRLEIDPDELDNESEVKSVEWNLPKDYFTKHKVTTTDSASNFRVIIEAWKQFEVNARIELKSGKKLQLKNVVTFNK